MRQEKPSEPRFTPRAGKVTALTPQVSHPERMSLFIDDHFVMGLSAFVALKVRVGQTLTLGEVEALAHAEQVEQAHEVALRRLETRPRSQAEIRRVLAAKGFDGGVCDEVLARLSDARLVNDRDFTKFWVENREGFRPRSARAIKYELRQKGISPKEISRAVKGLDEKESAYCAALSRAQRLKDASPEEFRQKLSGFLARRGFDYQVTRTTVARLWKELKNAEAPSDEEDNS